MSKEFKILMGVVGVLAALTVAVVSASSVVVLNDPFDVDSRTSLFDYSGGDFIYTRLDGDPDQAVVQPSVGGRLYLIGKTPVEFQINDADGYPLYFSDTVTLGVEVYGGIVGSVMNFNIQNRHFDLETTQGGFRLSTSTGLSVDIVDSNMRGELMVDYRGGRVRVFWEGERVANFTQSGPTLPGITIGCDSNGSFDNTLCVIFPNLYIIGRG